MDKYSKTVDTDTSEFLNIEDSTPTVKHSTASKIVAIIVCLFLAILVWLHVMNTSPETMEYTFTDIDYVENGVSMDKDIVLKAVGTKSFIADAKRADITVYYEYDNYKVDLVMNGTSMEDIIIKEPVEISEDLKTITIVVGK